MKSESENDVMLTRLQQKLKALAHVRHVLQCAIDTLSDKPGTWNHEQDRLASMMEEVFDMDYELGYEYRDDLRDQEQRNDVRPDSYDYWLLRERHAEEE